MVWPALAAGASRVATALAGRPVASFLAGTALGDLVGGVVGFIPGLGSSGGGGGETQRILTLSLGLGVVLSIVVAVGKVLEEAVE